jgi:hypothetical protein
MSFDIDLINPETQDCYKIAAARRSDMPTGGTYELGGPSKATLNITYNYSKLIENALGDARGVRMLYGMKAADTLQILDDACQRLPGKPHSDYWKATPGNARLALEGLRQLATLFPNGIWQGD